MADSNPARWLPAVVAAFGCALLGGCGTTPVFRDGKVLLPVIVAVGAAPEEQAAAEELAEVLGKMSGLSWPVRTEGRANEQGLHVGRDSSLTRLFPPLKVSDDILMPGTGEIGPDAFRILSRNGSVFIEGATPEATGFAVAWLLQHEGGVRWYAPGPAGEIIPRCSRWSLPKMHVVREPAYISREITGLDTPDEERWARRNGLHRRLEFSHALGSIFPPSAMNANPDWLPLLEGAHYRPLSETDVNWQPNLALPAVAEHAAKMAATAFRADGKRRVFSLGINDTVRFDQSEATRALVEPLHYFRGMPDYSPLVFQFMNRAAESLSSIRSDRYLGCLAYFWCENSPPFPVHPQVVPYLTTDRSQYYDQEYRKADLALMSRWRDCGVRAFGLWEYAYGRGFVIPRIPTEALAESVREGWHRGARGYLAEVDPQWGFDAFKVWMLARLLWDPDRSITELTDDFYHGYYAAAETPMRQFFSRCEKQWMDQGGAAHWLKYYQQEDQALLFSAGTCRELRQVLDEAAKAVKNDAVVSARIACTSRRFAVTETYVEYDSIRRALNSFTWDDARTEEASVAALIRKLVVADLGFRTAIAIAAEDDSPVRNATICVALERNDPVPRLLWVAGQRDGMAPSRILRMAEVDDARHQSWFALASVLAAGLERTAPNLVANSSFSKLAGKLQEPRFLYPRFGPLPARWQVRAMPTELAEVKLSDADSSNGRRALRIKGAWDTQVYQWIPVEPDCMYVATARLRGESGAGNDSGLFLTFLDRAGSVLGDVRTHSMTKGGTPNWRIAVQAAEAPDDAAWVGIGIGCSRQNPEDWLEVENLELRGVIRPEMR